jgi:hypothetical protein
MEALRSQAIIKEHMHTLGIGCPASFSRRWLCEGRRRSKVPGEERSGDPEPEQIAEHRVGGLHHKRVEQCTRNQILFGLNNTERK